MPDRCGAPHNLNGTPQEMTPEAEIVNVRFTKSVIASKQAFTYEEAQIRKDDPYVTPRSGLRGRRSHYHR